MSNEIHNPTQYLVNNLDKIKNFDYKWTTLITNKPLLFEDLNYAKILPFIENTITDWEIEKFKAGEIQNLYANFETLLMLNLKRYDRIMNLATMLFRQYVTIDDTNYDKKLDKIVSPLWITPTKLACMALTSTKSTKTELQYAWGYEVKEPTNPEISYLEHNWNLLYQHSINFRLFMQYNAARVGTSGFRETWVKDITNNQKLAQVTRKFTQKSNAVDDSSLESLFDYHLQIEEDKNKLLKFLKISMDKMFNNERKNYAIYVYNNEFFLHSIKFSMRVAIQNNRIVKEYLANSYECFIAETFLVESMNAQINWVKKEFPEELQREKQILMNLLFDMINRNYKDVVLVKMMYGNVVSKVTLSGIFANVRINEELLIDNRVIKTNTVVYSKQNATKYLINRGYYLFGSKNDIDELLNLIDNNTLQTLTREIMTNHYRKYTKPIIKHLFDVIQLYRNVNNDIIDVMVYDKINPDKINNINIGTTNLKTDKNPLDNIIHKSLNKKQKSYWRVIE